MSPTSYRTAPPRDREQWSIAASGSEVNLGGSRCALVTMRARNPSAFKLLGASVGGFVRADDAKYEVVREMAEAARKLPAPK